MRRNGGFTLVELMIAVAILGILAGVLVYSFNRPANKVKTSSEVAAMFAELHRAQGQYFVENGTYLSTGTDESAIFPGSPTNSKQSVSIIPDEWTALRIQPTAQNLYCGYVAVAGTAEDVIPTFATDFGMEQPASSWYALYARCNADGNSAVDATYFASSVDQTLVKRGEGN